VRLNSAGADSEVKSILMLQFHPTRIFGEPLTESTAALAKNWRKKAVFIFAACSLSPKGEFHNFFTVLVLPSEFCVKKL